MSLSCESQPPFQSRSGFSPYFDKFERRASQAGQDVSIPFWVFSLFRHWEVEAYADDGEVSIPFWVFSLFRHSTHWSTDETNTVGFQSRSGFSPYFDTPTASNSAIAEQFQSRSGFSPYFDTWRAAASRRTPCFNPVLGFLPISTARPARTVAPSSGFNPVLGFLPISTSGSSGSSSKSTFQSRSGFSPYFDWSAGASAIAGHLRFNPVLGFLPISTRTGLSARRQATEFQSRSGFSPYFDMGSILVGPAGILVSIPFWVFSLFRRGRWRQTDYDRDVSIPFWVFSLFRPGGPPRRPHPRPRFNPALGFLPISTRWGAERVFPR